MSKHDVIFLGTSLDALVAAARLAAEGRRVLLLDSRSAPGGPVATEPFAPGFSADTGVLSAALDPEVTAGLGLSVEVIARDTVTALGPEAQTWGHNAGGVSRPSRAAPIAPPEREPERSVLGYVSTGSAARASERGAQQVWEHHLPSAARLGVHLLREIYKMDPPRMPVPAAEDTAPLGAIASRLRGFGGRDMHEVLRLTFMSARDYLEESVSDTALRGALGGAAIRGMSEGPFAPGTLFNLLHHEAVGDGLFRSTARGGTGALAKALADKAAASGAEIRLNVAGPLTVDVSLGVARGVALGNGERLLADRIVSSHDARATFTRLVAPHELEPEHNRAIRHTRYRGSAARINLALGGLPRFNGVEEPALRGSLVLAPDLAYLERAWDDAKRGAVSRRPFIEVALPTVADPSLAPEGNHVLSAWVQYVPYGRGDRDALLKLVVERLAEVAPELPGLVLHSQVLLPEDLEARFGLTEGHLYGGEVNLAQAFFLRPLPGFSHYHTPIENLYMTGSAAHPAGYSGRAGWNLARSLLGAGAAS